LRDIYEERGRVEYAEPVVPDPEIDRKFAVVCDELRRLLPARSMLDAGCGDGRYFTALPALGPLPGRVVGIDIADSILRTARGAATRANVDVELIRANLEELPFADSEFDLVLCVQAIEHLLDPTRGIRELARVTSAGGKLLLTTDNRRMLITKALNAPRWAVAALAGKRRSRVQFEFPHLAFTRGELARLLADAGFAVERVRTFRFSILGAGAGVTRRCNQIDARLPDVGIGDVLLVVARRGRP